MAVIFILLLKRCYR